MFATDLGQDPDLERRLARCKAYNDFLTKHVMTMMEMADRGNPPPNAATLAKACREMLVGAYRAAYAVEKGQDPTRESLRVILARILG